MVYMVKEYIIISKYVLVCPTLSAPHGQISYNPDNGNGGHRPNTNFTYSCNNGYSFGSSGSRVRTCQSSGTWNGSPKYCYRKYFQYYLFIYYIINYFVYLCDQQTLIIIKT